MSDLESSDSDWEGWEDEESCATETTCLFCTDIFCCPEDVLFHCRSEHNFDFVALSRKFVLDAISYIKIVNYIRIHNPPVADLQQWTKGSAPWDNDLYMKPAQIQDPLLTFDIESFIEEHSTNCNDVEMEMVELPRVQYETLLQRLKTTERQLENAWDRIERMKETAKNAFCIENHNANKSPEEHRAEADNYYFSSYDHFGIHHEMLQDKVRTMAYRDAILKNKDKFANKRVMDVGCGTAILSLFAARAGATKVLAIDKSDIIYQAMDIIRENKYDHVIDLFKGQVEDSVVPDEKVDIIISEWMGYFLLFEGMLDSVLYARDKYLSPGGLMFPDRCTMSVVAVSDPEKYGEYVTFWNDVYGYQMSVMKREVVKEANVESINANALCSYPIVIKELDLTTCTVQDAEFAVKFELMMTRECEVTSIVGFFDSMFEKDLNHKVTLSTSPVATQTHWKQTMFLLPEPYKVKSGERIPCRLSCRKNRRDPRTLIVKIDFGTSCNQYYLA